MARLSPSAGFSPIIQYAEVTSSIVTPGDFDRINGGDKENTSKSEKYSKVGTRYGLGGLKWSIPMDHKIDDYLLVWIGSEDSAFSNVVLTFNSCEIGEISFCLSSFDYNNSNFCMF